MTQSSTVLDVHADHRQWQNQVSMWKLDLQAWQGEHKVALEELADVVEMIKLHQTASSAHEKDIAAFADAVKAHEHKLVDHLEKEKGGDVGEPAGALAHEQAKKTAETLLQAHERIKKHHHTAMAHVMSLKAALEAAM